MRLLIIGDVVGQPGRRVVQQKLGELRERCGADLVIANGENIAGGSGITPQLYERLLSYGVDGVTLGDHCFRQKTGVAAMDSMDRLVRPANLPKGAAGRGSMVLRTADGRAVHVTTLLGRMFMERGPAGDDPFAAADRFLESVPAGEVSVIEIHAEATSEKVALGHYVDGRASVVFGTHTHIPTADSKVLPGGTAYITDLGMTGPYDSVLGRRKERVVGYMSTGMPAPFDVAEGDVRLCGVFVALDDAGKAVRCERVEAAADTGKPPFAE